MTYIQDQLQEFLRIAKHLNSLGIIPTLYGSLGLYFILGLDKQIDDIDILLPKKYLEANWQGFCDAMASVKYVLHDAHEHEFVRQGFKVGFADEESLVHFAGINYKSLQIAERDGATFKILAAVDYLNVYQSALKDDYRQGKKRGADQEKINLILEKLGSA